MIKIMNNRLLDLIGVQLDKWSLVHLILPIALCGVFLSCGTLPSMAFAVALLLPLGWEFLDFINWCANFMLGWSVPFLDSRGVSWVDFLLGAIPVFSVAMFYPGLAVMQHLYITIQFLCEVTVCLALFQEDEWI